MSATNGANEQNGQGRTRVEEMKHLIQIRDWDALDILVGFSPEEAERILREEPMIDAAEVNRMMEELDRIDDQKSTPIGDCEK
jgi:rRNA processing protein Krr1/Pno1